MATGNQDTLRKQGNAGRRAADFIDESEQMFDAAEREVMKFSAQRKENHEFLFGDDQWSEVRAHDLALISGRDVYGSDAVLLQDSVLADTLDARVSQVVGAVPRFEAVAASASQADMTKAKYVTKMIPGFWRHLTMVAHFNKAMLTAGAYNLAFGKVAWDRTMGDIVNGKPQGEVSLAIVPPFNVFPEPGCERVMPERVDPTDARWLFHRFVTTLGDLKAAIHDPGSGKTPTGGDVVWRPLPGGKELTPADGTDGLSVRDRMRDVLRTKDGSLSDAAEIRGMAYYQHPSAAYLRGRYVLMLPDNGNYVLEYRESLPDDAVVFGRKFPGLFPFYTMWDKQALGRLAGRSRVAAAIPHQRIINKTMTYNEKTQDTHQPKTYFDRRFGIDLDAVVDDPRVGLAIGYDSRPGGEFPKTEWPPEMAAFEHQAEAKISWHTRRIEDRIGAHSLRNYPRRSVTATEVLQVMRSDEAALTQEARLAEDCAYVPATKLVLQMVQRHYGNDRMIHFLGDRNRLEVERVMAEDILFKDVLIVSTGSSMPMNRKKMLAEVMELVRVGLFSSTDEKEQKHLRRMLFDLVRLESSIDSTADELDIKNARAENMQIVAGHDIPPPGPGDNDPIHLYGPGCHFEFLKSAEYRNLPDDKRRMALRFLQAHMMIHAARIDEKVSESGVSMSQLVSTALNRVRPAPAQQGQQTPGPAGLPGPANQPVDTVNEAGTRVYRERPGAPKTGNQATGQGEVGK